MFLFLSSPAALFIPYTVFSSGCGFSFWHETVLLRCNVLCSNTGHYEATICGDFNSLVQSFLPSLQTSVTLTQGHMAFSLLRLLLCAVSAAWSVCPSITAACASSCLLEEKAAMKTGSLVSTLMMHVGSSLFTVIRAVMELGAAVMRHQALRFEMNTLLCADTADTPFSTKAVQGPVQSWCPKNLHSARQNSCRAVVYQHFIGLWPDADLITANILKTKFTSCNQHLQREDVSGSITSL